MIKAVMLCCSILPYARFRALSRGRWAMRWWLTPRRPLSRWRKRPALPIRADLDLAHGPATTWAPWSALGPFRKMSVRHVSLRSSSQSWQWLSNVAWSRRWVHTCRQQRNWPPYASWRTFEVYWDCTSPDRTFLPTVPDIPHACSPTLQPLPGPSRSH